VQIVPQLDRYPRLVALAQTDFGKLAALAVFGLLLWLNGNPVFVGVTLTVGVIGLFPQHRRLLLALASVCWLLSYSGRVGLGFIKQVAAGEGIQTGSALLCACVLVFVGMFCALGLFLRIVEQRPRNLVGQRPVLVMVGSFLCLLMAAGTAPLRGWPKLALWSLLAFACQYLWLFAYAIADCTSKAPDPYPGNFGTFFPFWMGSATPIGKGAAFLRKVEVRTPNELAALQLNAIKQLIWLLALNVVLGGIRAVVYGGAPAGVRACCEALGFHIPALLAPTLEAALDQTAAGIRVPLHLAWASVLMHFVEKTLVITIWGNTIVACCRMAGFNILRNTYRPFYATTLTEFWNRFYFYFKELLAEFFFFPAYIRYFKKYRKLRLIAATIAAATFGNMIYHFCLEIGYVLDLGLAKAVTGFQVYTCYALILGVAISISQLRGKRVPPASMPFYRRALAVAGVLAFYCLLEVFDYDGRSRSLGTHLVFFRNLFTLS
jgi:hypothetical protein